VIFYGFLALVVLGLAFWLSRSAVVKQLLRGNGTDRGGTERDDLFARQGTGPSWMSEDPGKRASQVEPRSEPPRD
jgi:hypothetical protein